MIYLFAILMVVLAFAYRWLAHKKVWKDPMIPATYWELAQHELMKERKNELKDWIERRGLL